MTKEKMTAPVASVGADGEQPLNNKITNQSIADLCGSRFSDVDLPDRGRKRIYCT